MAAAQCSAAPIDSATSPSQPQAALGLPAELNSFGLDPDLVTNGAASSFEEGAAPSSRFRRNETQQCPSTPPSWRSDHSRGRLRREGLRC